ncbi:hypothetical protein [Thermanaerovibrio acidaminovorans]|jgi:hypothetical protein|uniref:Uncharacterized protein n=1 Tax=Thermanaerovibrio acidaminovorans (strain ATCC 49978 / DSM 6589 / Su883) TaxID=525903 RepID=D1B5Q3_THEAS|nr:hypothetical protein [Thermanaerovibrio acidaminovorans]ACZ19344.1 hypothetical protein Taci_1112 [Thermanaerovibrio acidaminovorans DSM 6589]
MHSRTQDFKARVLQLAKGRMDPEFVAYVEGVTDRMWEHVVHHEGLSPEEAEGRLRSFFEEDRRFFRG